MLIGCRRASAVSARSRRESTRPAVSCPAAVAATAIRGSRSSAAPGLLPGGQAGLEQHPVGGRPVGGDHPDGDAVGPGAEGREDVRCPGRVEAGAEQLPDDRGLDDHGGTGREFRGRPERSQVPGGEPVSPERRAHRRVAGDRIVAADLTGNPAGRLGADHGLAARRGDVRRRAGVVPDGRGGQRADDQAGQHGTGRHPGSRPPRPGRDRTGLVPVPGLGAGASRAGAGGTEPLGDLVFGDGPGVGRALGRSRPGRAAARPGERDVAAAVFSRLTGVGHAGQNPLGARHTGRCGPHGIAQHMSGGGSSRTANRDESEGSGYRGAGRSAGRRA